MEGVGWDVGEELNGVEEGFGVGFGGLGAGGEGCELVFDLLDVDLVDCLEAGEVLLVFNCAGGGGVLLGVAQRAETSGICGCPGEGIGAPEHDWRHHIAVL